MSTTTLLRRFSRTMCPPISTCAHSGGGGGNRRSRSSGQGWSRFWSPGGSVPRRTNCFSNPGDSRSLLASPGGRSLWWSSSETQGSTICYPHECVVLLTSLSEIAIVGAKGFAGVCARIPAISCHSNNPTLNRTGLFQASGSRRKGSRCRPRETARVRPLLLHLRLQFRYFRPLDMLKHSQF
jgi:hypothetical protein